MYVTFLNFIYVYILSAIPLFLFSLCFFYWTLILHTQYILLLSLRRSISLKRMCCVSPFIPNAFFSFQSFCLFSNNTIFSLIIFYWSKSNVAILATSLSDIWPLYYLKTDLLDFEQRLISLLPTDAILFSIILRFLSLFTFP